MTAISTRLRTAIGPRVGERPRVREVGSDGSTSTVDAYWGEHTVPAPGFRTARGSRRQLEGRFDQYPLFREFSGLWGEHDGEVVLDYGCGPGNDLVGFALNTGAARLIGIDVSAKALAKAADRLALHRVDPARVDLVLSRDGELTLPFEDCSIDYVQSQGVLHHVSDPEPILRELHRVARPGARGSIMVYNRDSVWRNLYVAWVLMVREGVSSDQTIDEAFKRSTDGPECPISRNYSGADFVSICEEAGFEAEYLGGYLSRIELEMIDTAVEDALADAGLPPAQRAFLEALSRDERGYPLYEGMHAGIGGSYTLRKPVE